MNNLKKIALLVCVVIPFMLSSCKKENDKNKTAVDDQTEKKIDSLINQMSLEEKVGQMTQITLDLVCKGPLFDTIKEHEIDPVKLDSALQMFHVGSVLNTGWHSMPREQWHKIIGQIQDVATKKTKLKIPVLYGIDAIHGATYTTGATLFPQELALAATWDPSFAESAGSITAYEVRASAIPWNFSPVLDLGRQPLWSRFFETFGEDPYLATEMGNAIVRGYQGDDIGHPEKVAACLKHFVGYSFPFSGKDRTPILMPERLLREYYLVPFQNAIENGALTVMVNSSEINGTPVHSCKHILTDILKDELKFQGFAVSDWEDIKMLHTVHKIAASEKEAVKIAVNAGIDMSMVPLDYSFAKHLVALVKEGEVEMSRIDDAVRRILRVKFKLGLFKTPIYPIERYPKFGCAEFTEASYQAALEGITLLKNNNVLPLAKTSKVLVTGPGANSLNFLNGAWTHTWQGMDTTYNTPGKKTILDAIKDKIGKENVTYVEGTNLDKDINTSKAAAAAKKADYVVVCLSELTGTEKPGDIEDLTLSRVQLQLVKELSKSGKPILLVLNFDRPRIINEVDTLASGVLMAYRPGNEGGRAIAEILFGDYNPCGKLPFTYPRYSNSFYTYDHKFSETRDRFFKHNSFNPQYEFGHGLSYTTFKYSNLKIDKDTIGMNDTLTVQISVSNTGKLAGKEVVQIYTSDLYASITPSLKRLKKFKKVLLKPGESQNLTFKILPSELGFVNKENKWVTEPGEFKVLVGDLNVGFFFKE